MADDPDDIAETVTGIADEDELDLVRGQTVTRINGVRVFDVGQGDCIGLRDQDDNVFCYVDYGGLNDHPDKNDPAYTAVRMPVQNNGVYVSIVLTHWDKDHYWSAAKKNPDAQRCYWLVPRQHVSPQATLFAESLVDAECWPESLDDNVVTVPAAPYYDIGIRKCGEYDESRPMDDRNLTGLAVTLTGFSVMGIRTVMILPGDCPFDALPQVPDLPICALVAYHHGASKHWTPATSAAIANRNLHFAMTYSYGHNRYGHPDTSNYEPEWHGNSEATPDVRSKPADSTDMDW